MEVNHVSFSYDRKHPVLPDLSAVIRKGKITSIIGPNGCGKSTLLGLLTKLRKPSGGSILLDGREINDIKGKEYARTVASVCQINDGSADITAEEFVSYGRTPHKKRFEPLSAQDKIIIDGALSETGLDGMREKKLCHMSGGERQRVYIATALCQQPEVLFLDEPTSYLDMYYQLEVLEIVRRINREGITIVMVLHDVNQAYRYSDDVIVMKNGGIVRRGAVADVLTPALIEEVYDVKVEQIGCGDGMPYFVPVVGTRA